MSTLMQTSTGCLVDLSRPDLSRIDIRRDIAEPLAALARFNGHQARRHPKGHVWSVAQHCVVGAKAMLEETGSPLFALAFLVHDAHEAFIGDITTPAAHALAKEMGHSAGGIRIAEYCLTALHNIKRRLDVEIWRLTGVSSPTPDFPSIKNMDRRMLGAEARQILEITGDTAWAWAEALKNAAPVRTHGALTPWPEKRASDEWMALWTTWTTSLRAAAASTDSRRHDGARSAA